MKKIGIIAKDIPAAQAAAKKRYPFALSVARQGGVEALSRT